MLNKSYFKKNFTKKLIYMRIIWSTIGILIVLLTTIPMYIWAANADDYNYGTGNFIDINIVLNSGISFGMFSNNTTFVYFIQWFVSIMILIVAIFSNKWYYSLFLSLSFTGGFFNVIDRLIPVYIKCFNIEKHDQVLDYFHFVFGNTSWNFPDAFIISGIIGVSLFYFINLLRDLVKKK
ncbi:MAG: signal peptidase II [Mycoplasmataceae bacterium]|jgi:lipoprotein signal peptidase|nr:signal peptidase II [Mycoplasmataceae bacterium]